MIGDFINIKAHEKQSDIRIFRNNFNVLDYEDLFKKDFITKWNKEIKGLRTNKDVLSDLQALFNFNETLAIQKMLLFRIVACIDNLSEQKMSITTSKMATIIHRIVYDDYLQSNSKIAIIRDLSILELSMLIAIKHHNDIYDHDPFNFEIILTRLHKFQSSGEFSFGSTDRNVLLKAFDVLKVRIHIQFFFFFF